MTENAPFQFVFIVNTSNPIDVYAFRVNFNMYRVIVGCVEFSLPSGTRRIPGPRRQGEPILRVFDGNDITVQVSQSACHTKSWNT